MTTTASPPSYPACSSSNPVYLSPKELGWELAELGVPSFDERKCRRLASVLVVERPGAVIRGTHCRLDQAVDWLLLHPDWRPFAKGKGGVK